VIFLVEYNRKLGKLIQVRDFRNEQRHDADDVRLDLELDLAQRQVDHEVVLLEAESRDALRQTHKRYFNDLQQLLKDYVPT
jgi:hypothetical protein